MKRLISLICLLLIVEIIAAQDVGKRLADAVINFENSSQMKSGIIGFLVTDQKTGSTIFAKNANLGLAVASSQKVLTSAAALDILGSGYRFKTQLAYDGTIDNGTLIGNLCLVGYGDPTLGSWRYNNAKENVMLNKWTSELQQAGIAKIKGNIIGYIKSRETQTIPGGWVWDDIGNYYGAGVSALNWRENQYHILLQSGSREGDKVNIVSVVPPLNSITLTNELTTGKPGSGDNAYIYLPPYAVKGFMRGTIPPNQKAFTISGSYPDPPYQLGTVLKDALEKKGIINNSSKIFISNDQTPAQLTTISTHLSPPLDSINYWFLKKSINLYGEAIVKAVGYEKNKEGSTEAGIKIIKSFWIGKGIDESAINIVDGSGLSPQNRVTAKALVKAMQYARLRPWFNILYNALPIINNIKMKSGSIGGVRSFTGYIGNYTFAIIVNNYNGTSAELVQKMYTLLNNLK